MLDTNICIYVMRHRSSAIIDRFDRETPSLCMSSITYGELRYGAMKSDRPAENLRSLAQFASHLAILSFDDGASAHFGDLRAALERAGTPCGPYDMLIAGHARSLGLTVVTNNRREFDRMPGLKVENWV